MPLRAQHAGSVTVLILGGGRGTRLDPLTRLRSKPAVPLAGKYRLIDVPISNCINSGMTQMYVLTQFNSHSLHRHIGRTYRFDSFSQGFAQILAAQQTPGSDSWFQGTADAVRQYANIIEDAGTELVLILSGDHLYRWDYRDLVREHREAGAAVSIGVLPCSEAEISEFGAVRVDESGRVVEFREKPKTPEARSGMEVDAAQLAREGVPSDRPYLASMGIYLFDRAALLEALAGDATDFGRDILPPAVERCRVQASFFKGYWRDIGTVRAFFDAHMDLLGDDPAFTFYDPRWPFFTHPRHLPGTMVRKSRVDGCSVAEGAKVLQVEAEHSIIGVRSVITRSQLERVLMMGADDYEPETPSDGRPAMGIGEGCVIRDAIIDKNARIGEGCRIAGGEGLDDAEGEGWMRRDGIVVVHKNAVIPPDTSI
jgi:glucose-1-phosphate adenylyltransferase